jgi:hypothetical protein
MTRLVVFVDGVEDAGLSVVDALARLQLAARRSGGGVRVYDAPAELVQVLDLAGLADVVPCEARSDVKDRRLAEIVEVLVADEVVDVGDPPL